MSHSFPSALAGRLAEQLARDTCCGPAEVLDGESHFTVWRPVPGRRTFPRDEECALRIVVVNRKLLVTGREPLVRFCRERFARTEAAWLLDGPGLALLQDRLREDGLGLGALRPFFLYRGPAPAAVIPEGLTIRWFEEDEMERFRGDARFKNALTFCPGAPDVLAAGAFRGGEPLALAGCSRDSADFWQIGVDVTGPARGRGLGLGLVTLLREEITRRGAVPFYGMAVSNVPSMALAIAAGFRPAWAEIDTILR